ncbi:hypothetical protein D9M69_599610 [compost metagenome]
MPSARCDGVSANVVRGSFAGAAGSSSSLPRKKAQAHTSSPMPASSTTTLMMDHMTFSALGVLPISGSCGQLLV